MAWAPALGHSFQFDDETKIVAGASLRAPLGDGLVELHRPGYSETKGRPLAWLSLALDRRLFGLEPFGWNLTSLLIHLVNILLVYGFGQALSASEDDPDRPARGSALWPALGAAMFAVHPLASEAVLYLNARGNLLATGFYLAALSVVIRRSHRPALGLLLFVLLALAALLSKEMAISLLVMAPLCGWWTRRATQKNSLPVIALAVALGGLGCCVAVASGALGAALSLGVTIPTLLGQAHALVVYLGLSLCPLPALLSVDHDFPYPPASGWLLPLVSLAFLAILVALALSRRRRDPVLALLLLWPLITHAPTSLFPRAEALVEYRAYLPLAGSALLLGRALRRRPGIVLALLPLLVALCVLRGRAWATPLDLWQDAASKSQHSARARNNLGSALEATGRMEQAIASYTEAVRLDPALALGHYNLGTALVRRGQPALGIAELERALELRPGFARARFNLGQALLLIGQTERGRVELERAKREGAAP